MAVPNVKARAKAMNMFSNDVEAKLLIGALDVSARPIGKPSVGSNEMFNLSEMKTDKGSKVSDLPIQDQEVSTAAETKSANFDKASFDPIPDTANETNAWNHPPPPIVTKSSSLFTTSNGTDLNPISAATKETVKSMFAEEQQSAVQTSSFFSTGGGAALPPVSEKARVEAKKLLADDDEHDQPELHKPGFDSSLNGTVLDTPSRAPIKQSDFPLVHPENMTPLKSRTAASSSVARSSIPLATPLRETTNIPSRPAMTAAFTSPMLQKGKPYNRPLATPLQVSKLGSEDNVLGGSPTASKRVGIGLGMTPRAQSVLAKRPKFVSPFKKMDEAGKIQETPVKRNSSMLRLESLAKVPVMRDRKASAPVRENACFDLNSKGDLSAVALGQTVCANEIRHRNSSTTETRYARVAFSSQLYRCR